MSQACLAHHPNHHPPRVFSGAAEVGGIVKGIRVPDGARLSNSRIKPKGDVCSEAQAAGAAGLVYVRVKEGGAIEAAKPVTEGLTPEQAAALLAAFDAQPVRRARRRGEGPVRCGH